MSVRPSTTAELGPAREGELVVAAAAGDIDAFQALYKAHVQRVHRFAARRVGHNAADDITAETFARAFAAMPRFQWTGKPFSAWLFRIARNQIIARARSGSRMVVGLPEGSEPTVESHEGQVETALEAELLRGALGELSEAHRRVVELRYLEELSVAEVAAVLDISEEAVRAQTYRALKRLRERFPSMLSQRRTPAPAPGTGRVPKVLDGESRLERPA